MRGCVQTFDDGDFYNKTSDIQDSCSESPQTFLIVVEHQCGGGLSVTRKHHSKTYLLYVAEVAMET